MPVRVSSLPADGGDNPYLRLYGDALAAHGIVAAAELRPGVEGLQALAGHVDAIHIHWGTEELWRSLAGSSRAQALLGVWRFWRILARARRQGVRLVWTLHDVEHHEWSGRADRLGYRVLARMADLCICHDADASHQFEQRLGGDPAKVVLMPMGNFDGEYRITRSRPEVLGELGLDPAKRTLVCAGAIRPYKNFELAIDALPLLGDAYQLVIAGGAHEPATVSALRERCGRLPNARFVAQRLSAEDFGNLVRAGDCVLLPYRKITGSAALLAAATLGRGVVTSNLPFFASWLADEPEAGVVAEAPGAQGLAEAITRFFALPPERRGQACRRLADRYPWEAVVEPVVAWYQSRFPNEVVQHRRDCTLEASGLT